jgi:predicted RNA-binding protein with PIN domain
MHWLIDGYNLMHAGGRIGQGIKPEQFCRARRRFLDELSEALGAEMANDTTVVFDANTPPFDFPLDSFYRGLRVVFALGDENADARIESMIAEHATPKTLTVVSTDRRIRQAATRRRAGSMTAEQYWQLIDDRKERMQRERSSRRDSARSVAKTESQEDDTAFWLRAFGEIDESPEIQELSAPQDTLLSDAEIERIVREVEREFGESDPLRVNISRKPRRS